jgi:hypothetical protein
MAARIGKVFHNAMSNAFERLSGVRLIGPVIRKYASHSENAEQRNEKVSEKLGGVFKRWSIKFSAEYYEAKEREKAAKAASEKMLGRHPPPDSGMMSSAHSEIIPPGVSR